MTFLDFFLHHFDVFLLTVCFAFVCVCEHIIRRPTVRLERIDVLDAWTSPREGFLLSVGGVTIVAAAQSSRSLVGPRAATAIADTPVGVGL